MADENAVEKVIKKSPFGRWLWTISTMLVLPVIGFVGNAVVNRYTKTMETIDSIGERLGELERDKANDDAIWASIADQQQRLTEMRIRHEAAMRHVDWLSQRMIWPTYTTSDNGKSTLKSDPPKRDPKEVPPNDPEDPKVDPDKFRKDYEQHHPDVPKKK